MRKIILTAAIFAAAIPAAQFAVAQTGVYPNKPVIISEAGWATNSNGRGIQPHNTSQDLQDIYVRDLLQWADSAGILTFVFEAFDEPWKGSPDPLEPEKHWGLYTVDREPKLAMRNISASMLAGIEV